MAKGPGTNGARRSKARNGGTRPTDIKGMLWRVERLERQVRRLSELVREHAADADRLVQIVAEDREVLRQQLLRGKRGSLSGKSGILHS